MGLTPTSNSHPTQERNPALMPNIPPNIQAVPYEYTMPPDGPYDAYRKEHRWIIVDTSTGKILDDAQGFGYKSAPNAYRAYGFKQTIRKCNTTPKKLKEKALTFWRKHPRLQNDILTMRTYGAKNGRNQDDIDKECEQVILDHAIVPKHLTPTDLLRWC